VEKLDLTFRVKTTCGVEQLMILNDGQFVNVTSVCLARHSVSFAPHHMQEIRDLCGHFSKERFPGGERKPQICWIFAL
jgi:hypothetical protein